MRLDSRYRRGFAVSLLALGLAAASAHGQGPPGPERLRWSLGLGVISSPRPYVGADNQTRVIPLLELETRRFYFRGIQAGYELIDGEAFGLDLIGRARFGGYDEEDSRFLAGMADRRETFEVGLAAAWELGRFELEATAVADALGRSDGVEAGLELSWTKIFGRGRAGLVPAVGVVWQSSDLVDYYAGVRPEEARPGRPAYRGGSAVNLAGGLRGFARVGERTRLLGLVRLERLAGAYGDSPIIADRWGYFAVLGLSYGL